MRILKSTYFQLPFFLIFGGVLGACIQNENLWDFTNYHFYNAWAFLEGRVGYDIAVGGGNTYFNPLLDIPLYLLIKYFNNYPYFILFCQGIPLGAALYVFYKIVLLFFNSNTLKDNLSVICSMAIAITGWSLFSQMGSCSNEIPIAFLVLWSFYVLIKNIMQPTAKTARNMFYGGLIMGAALGLKLTAITYCISSALVLFLFYKSFTNPVKTICLYALGGFVGFVVFHGYWSFILWDLFQNPFFPFGNGIFKSSWFLQENFRDRTFTPESFAQYLFHPFYLATFKLRTEGTLLIIDYRYVITYILLVIYLGKYLWCRLQKQSICADKKFRLFVAIFLCSYIVWLLIFTILRYYIVPEMFTAIIITKAIGDFWPKKPYSQAVYISLWILILYSLLGTPYYSDVLENRKELARDRKYFLYDLVKDSTQLPVLKKFSKSNKLVDFEELNIPNNTLLQMYNLPCSGVLPLLNRKASVRGIMMRQFNYVTIDKGEQYDDVFDMPIWRDLKEKIIKEHKGPVFQLISFSNLPDFWQHKDILFRKNTYCRSLRNNFHPVYLCVPHAEVKNIFIEKASGEEILNGFTEE